MSLMISLIRAFEALKVVLLQLSVSMNQMCQTKHPNQWKIDGYNS